MSANPEIQFTEQNKHDHDRIRGRKQKEKWAHGEASPTRGYPGRRPVKALGTNSWDRKEITFRKGKEAKLDSISRKQSVRPDTDPDTSDHEDDYRNAFRGAAPDAGYTYSYDANKSANKGSQILGQAVAKAVEKYETKATEKLVKDEYEFVGHESAPSNSEASTDEDEFELL